MADETKYKVGDVVITPSGKGEIIFKDKSPTQVKWLYMLEKKNGKWIGPFNHNELELINE